MEANNFTNPTWLLNSESEQDFCFGVKASPSQHPVYLTPPSASPAPHNAEEDWTTSQRIYDDVMLSTPHAFDDILLDAADLGPDDLFSDIPSSVPSVPKAVELPKVVIKLRKVKHPRAKRLDQEKLFKPRQSSETPLHIDTQTISPHHDDFFAAADHFLDDLLAHNTPQEQRGNVTLSEAFSLNDAENILDGLLAGTPQDDSWSGKSTNVGSDLRSESPIQMFTATSPNEQQYYYENSLQPHDQLVDLDLDGLLLQTEESLYSPDHLMEESVAIEPITFEVNPTNSMIFEPTPVENFMNINYLSPPLSVQSSITSPFNSGGYSSDYSMSPDNREDDSKKKRKRAKINVRVKMSPGERYLRKKEQNKVAALKYRQKKKDEDQGIAEEIRKATDEQEKLKEQQKNLLQEVNLIKKMLREALLK